MIPAAASWLHHAIETYEVPGDLAATTNDRGDTIPQRIFPIFRDEEELPADADLASPIYRALDASRFVPPRRATPQGELF